MKHVSLLRRHVLKATLIHAKIVSMKVAFSKINYSSLKIYLLRGINIIIPWCPAITSIFKMGPNSHTLVQPPSLRPKFGPIPVFVWCLWWIEWYWGSFVLSISVSSCQCHFAHALPSTFIQHWHYIQPISPLNKSPLSVSLCTGSNYRLTSSY
jgi:hypothetical protein